MLALRLAKFVICVCSKSAHMMDQRPPFDFCRSWSSSRNVLLWCLVLSLAVNL